MKRLFAANVRSAHQGERSKLDGKVLRSISGIAFRLTMAKSTLYAVLFYVTLSPTLGQCQQLTIQTETGKKTVLVKADIEALPHTKVSTRIADTTSTFEGVSLQSLLEKAGIVFGESLRGKRLASCLLVEAADGYRVVIALPEIDAGFTDKQIVVAFSQDEKPLDAKTGPYRLVIPDEKRLARWVRQVTTLTIVEVQ